MEWGERAAEQTKPYAGWRRYGAPSAFLSLAPDDVRQPTVLQLSDRVVQPNVFPEVDDGLQNVVDGEASRRGV